MNIRNIYVWKETKSEIHPSIRICKKNKKSCIEERTKLQLIDIEHPCVFGSHENQIYKDSNGSIYIFCIKKSDYYIFNVYYKFEFINITISTDYIPFDVIKHYNIQVDIKNQKDIDLDYNQLFRFGNVNIYIQYHNHIEYSLLLFQKLYTLLMPPNRSIH